MRLVRYNPLNEFAVLRNFFTDPSKKESSDWYPPVDIIEQTGNVILMMDLPGVYKDDIQINIEEKILTVSGERKPDIQEEKDTFARRERASGNFTRSFTLSPDLTEDVNAEFKEGVLKIILHKNKAKETVKNITIN